MPSPRRDAHVPASDVATSWSEPAAHRPENQEQEKPEQVFESMGGESVRETVIAEHVVQTSLGEHSPERDRQTTFVTATIDVASGEAQGEAHAAAGERYEPASQDTEARADGASRVGPSFELPPDLVQVETSPGRAQQAQDNLGPGPERFESRARRPRPPEEQVPNEPLVQVETRH